VTETLNGTALSVTRPVTEGRHVWSVRAFDRAGNISGWPAPATFDSFALEVYLPLIAKGFTVELPPAPQCYEAVVNGGFESSDGWTINPSGVLAGYVVSPTFPVHGGARSMRSGITDPLSQALSAYSSFSQTVIVPTDTLTATLSFWQFRQSTAVSGDRQQVLVYDAAGDVDRLVYDLVNDPVWRHAEFDLRLYAGQQIRLYFNTINTTNAGVTSMFIDDVSLQICR
jgi:hypothetical protein